MTPAFRQVAVHLCRFLHSIYGDLPDATRVEADIEGQSGGAYGTPHLEVTEVRVYSEASQLLPNFEIPYWKKLLDMYPNWFRECTTHQDRLDAVAELFQEERLYLEYELDWPDVNEKIISPLCLSIQELRALAGEISKNVSVRMTIDDFEAIMAHTLIRAAELLHEADGYDVGGEVDLPECMAFVVAREALRRYEVKPQMVSLLMGSVEAQIIIDGSLLFGEGILPVSYQERQLRNGTRFRDLAGLSPEQLTCVMAHTIRVLARYLEEVYDFESTCRILSLIPVLKFIGSEIEQRHLDASYQKELLFEN